MKKQEKRKKILQIPNPCIKEVSWFQALKIVGKTIQISFCEKKNTSKFLNPTPT